MTNSHTFYSYLIHMYKLCSLVLLMPIWVHAITFVPRPPVIKKPIIEKKVIPDVRKNSDTSQEKVIVDTNKNIGKPIKRWQWDIYEKHTVPIPYRFMMEAIRMKECNVPSGLCFRSDLLETYQERWNALAKLPQYAKYRKTMKKSNFDAMITEMAKKYSGLDIACMPNYRESGDVWPFQINGIHGEWFKTNFKDACQMNKLWKEQNDEEFVKIRDKIFEQQMLWVQQRLWSIFSDTNRTFEKRVFDAYWKHNGNTRVGVAKRTKWSNDVVNFWRKITRGQDFLK